MSEVIIKAESQPGPSLHGSQRVLKGRRLCWRYCCSFSLMLFTTGTLILLYVTDQNLYFQNWTQMWWGKVDASPPPTTIPSTSTMTPMTTTSTPITSSTTTTTKIKAQLQWKPPSPYHVAYPRDYTFVLDEEDVCSDQRPFLVLMVPVAPKDRAARDAIRRTWGNESLVQGKAVKLVFLLGLSSGGGSEKLQESVRAEREEHHDLLQSNFLDSYRNLTIKTIMMMEWVASHCRNAAYIMKIDSDMFLNVQNLMKMLLDPVTPKQNYITGVVTVNSPVIRNKNSKWYLPGDVYPDARYPSYCLGLGYVFSADLAKKIVDVSKHIMPLYLEDVHIGLCLKHLNLQPTYPPSYAHFRIYVPVPYNKCHFVTSITTILNGPAQLLQVWEDLHKPGNPC